MNVILAGITSLLQYLNLFVEQKSIWSHPRCCPSCGKSGLWLHGCYPRKANRSDNQDQLSNPISIQRYYCPACRKTCSLLPECLPPRRWYLWEVQQSALILVFSGLSFNAAAKKVAPSRHTISRWAARLTEQFRLHKDILCGHIIDLGQRTGVHDFWQACLNKISLAQAMRLCHVAGEIVP